MKKLIIVGADEKKFHLSVEEVHTVERCPHKADVVGPNPTFSNVRVV